VLYKKGGVRRVKMVKGKIEYGGGRETEKVGGREGEREGG